MKEISVLGLGYIGLPTAAMLATHGFMVHGVDIDPHAVEIINEGGIHIEEPGLRELVRAAVGSGALRAHLQPKQSDVYILAVPTPITGDKRADMRCVESAARSLVPLLKKGDLVILESTSPPGTTVDFLCPILAESGLEPGTDFMVAYCPERVLPGKIISELIRNTRIIGGVNAASATHAREIYASFMSGDIHMTDATTAEMVKLMENTYRDVNIALANELARMAPRLGINAWEVVRFANLHPRVNLHAPGPGVGGHCISVDPWFVVEKFPETAKLIAQARTINDAMPEYAYRMLLDTVADIQNPKVTLLGVTYKPDVDDVREAPALRMIEMIEENSNMRLSLCDPHVHRFHHPLSSLEEALLDSDCILLTVDHAEFKTLSPSLAARLMRTRNVIDTRNVLSRKDWVASGFNHRLLGRDYAETPVAERLEKVFQQSELITV